MRGQRLLAPCVAALALIAGIGCESALDEPDATWIEESVELDVEYRLVVDDERAEGGARAVASDHRFRSGDKFRLALRPGFEAHAYLYHRATGDRSYTRLFPQSRITVRNPLPADEETRLPDGDGRWNLDTKVGIEHLVLVVSGEPWDVEAVDSRGRISLDALDRQLAELEMTRRPGSYSAAKEDSWTKLFFDGEEPDAAIVARIPMRHE